MAEINTEGKVYFIRYPWEEKATHIALQVDTAYKGFEGICFIEPPCRPHMIEGSIGEKTENGFTFHQSSGGTWELVEMTHENFTQEFYKYVTGGKQLAERYQTTEELEAYYSENFPDYS